MGVDRSERADANLAEVDHVVVDPAFTNFNPLGFPVNDDHPRADTPATAAAFRMRIVPSESGMV